MQELSGVSASQPEDRLILAARAGDKQAYGRLVEICQSPLRSFLRTLSYNDRDLADDLAQDTFLTAYKRLNSYRGEGEFLSWLMGIGYRQFLQYTRKKKRRSQLLEASLHSISIPPIGDGITLIDLENALQKLSLPEKTTVTLNSREGFSHEEIARILDMPLGTVKSHIARGREKLKKMLYEHRSGNV